MRDARIARIKDGRTRLAYKSEHVTDLETGAIVSASIYPADAVDTQTLKNQLGKISAKVIFFGCGGQLEIDYPRSWNSPRLGKCPTYIDGKSESQVE